MDEFEEIMKLRNKGYTQREISEKLGRSLRTVQRYLSTGKIPVYKRDIPTRVDPLNGFEMKVEAIVNKFGEGRVPRCTDIYRVLVKEGYTGSLRTVQRKTEELRRSKRFGSEIYFEQEVGPGEVCEGDFKTIKVPFIDGIRKKHLWMMTLKNSGGSFASSFSNLTFESFAEGTVKGFAYFGGIPRKYRLDNLKPVVYQILRNGRLTTPKFNQLKDHYGFNPSFCSPGKGNEKGSVEAINRHFSAFLEFEIIYEDKIFRSDEEFESYLEEKVELYNLKKMEQIESEKIALSALPAVPFPTYSVELDIANKFGFVKAAGRRYSVSAKYRGRNIEIRLYSKKVELFLNGEKLQEHDRETGSGNKKPVIDFRDHIDYMLRKPGAFTYYKHKECFFPSEVFRELYEIYPDDKNFLLCLSLCKNHPVTFVEGAIKQVLAEEGYPVFEKVKSLIEPDTKEEEITTLTPLKPSLDQYDVM
ncbi:MAG: IS21 family transposase [Proteobacteria bacterium]|nr:IS21 family transposase [Pseudomonadota bacterium]